MLAYHQYSNILLIVLEFLISQYRIKVLDKSGKDVRKPNEFKFNFDALNEIDQLKLHKLLFVFNSFIIFLIY